MNKLKIGVIGAGGIADRRSIPGMLLSDRISLVAIMDPNRELCKKLQEKYDVKYAYDSYEELLKNNELDAVYIASPVFCHYEQVKAAADHGKHILCEKPFGLTALQAEEMTEYCKEKSVLLVAGFMMRFHNIHQRMREIVQSGALGSIVNAYSNFSCWYPDDGSWRQKKKLSGGGVLIDMAVHSIDLIQYITGCRMKKVSSISATRIFQYEVEDSASLMMEFAEGGSCTVNSFFCIPDEAAASRLEFYGTKGRLIAEATLSQVQGGHLSGILLTKNGVERITEHGDKSGNLYQKQFESFHDLILHKNGENATGSEMVFIQRLSEAAYLASIEGKQIEVPL